MPAGLSYSGTGGCHEKHTKKSGSGIDPLPEKFSDIRKIGRCGRVNQSTWMRSTDKEPKLSPLPDQLYRLNSIWIFWTAVLEFPVLRTVVTLLESVHEIVMLLAASRSISSKALPVRGRVVFPMRDLFSQLG